jgi:hypothetical protein
MTEIWVSTCQRYSTYPDDWRILSWYHNGLLPPLTRVPQISMSWQEWTWEWGLLYYPFFFSFSGLSLFFNPFWSRGYIGFVSECPCDWWKKFIRTSLKIFLGEPWKLGRGLKGETEGAAFWQTTHIICTLLLIYTITSLKEYMAICYFTSLISVTNLKPNSYPKLQFNQKLSPYSSLLYYPLTW